VVLLLSVPLLALLLWQWQQLGQAIVLLTRSPASLESIGPLSPQQLQEQRLCLGLPLLLWSPLVADPPRGAALGSSAVELQQPAPGQSELEPKPVSPSAVIGLDVTDLDVTGLGLSVDVGIAVEPEQASKDQQGSDLDQQIG
jgi:hypothetical protein